LSFQARHPRPDSLPSARPEQNESTYDEGLPNLGSAGDPQCRTKKIIKLRSPTKLRTH
jgi:hypothetical protein